jgi:predicted amidohydrolase
MRVASIQFKPQKGDPARAIEALRDLLITAGRAGARAAVCPEMAVQGYVWSGPPAILPYAEPADGPTYEMVRKVARKFDMWVTVGIAERDGTDLYNSALVVRPDGAIECCYRKMLLFELDQRWARPGDHRVSFTVDDQRVAVGICMDLNDEGFRSYLRDARPDQLWFLTNWLEEGLDVVGYWRRRLSPWNGALVAANTWGLDEEIGFSGRSLIWQHPGRILARAPRVGNSVIIADVFAEESRSSGSRGGQRLWSL